MFYESMHYIMVGITFQVTMYGQFFLISSHSIQRVLNMSRLEALILSLSPEVQALTREDLDTILTSLYSGPCPFPSYIPIVGFSKLTWLFATFFTYSFYPSTHYTQIRQPSAQFIYVILSSQQFDIG